MLGVAIENVTVKLGDRTSPVSSGSGGRPRGLRAIRLVIAQLGHSL